MSWSDVESQIPHADSIAFDGCHKIYVLLDAEQTAAMSSYGYGDNTDADGSRLYTSSEMTPEAMLATLHEWFEQSCGLRFISAVATVSGNPNEGFTGLIEQFELDEDEDDFNEI